jgi:hypothetical protein
MESEPEFPPPVYAPEVVARAILRCAERPMREVIVGGGGRMLTAIGAVAPRLTDRYMQRVMVRQQMKGEPRRPHDALDIPQRDGRRRGPTDRYTLQHSAYTRAAMSGMTRLLPIVALGALVVTTLAATRDRT